MRLLSTPASPPSPPGLSPGPASPCSVPPGRASISIPLLHREAWGGQAGPRRQAQTLAPSSQPGSGQAPAHTHPNTPSGKERAQAKAHPSCPAPFLTPPKAQGCGGGGGSMGAGLLGREWGCGWALFTCLLPAAPSAAPPGWALAAVSPRPSASPAESRDLDPQPLSFMLLGLLRAPRLLLSGGAPAAAAPGRKQVTGRFQGGVWGEGERGRGPGGQGLMGDGEGG